ncbi:MAG TPA: molybdopterin cofactor-binding domain-containing protein, partial [Candidatus Elarobacter sp.]|nr:molybdopterin cofactor-binding domain-containing protein [Candidatus Elarobacter sp.]
TLTSGALPVRQAAVTARRMLLELASTHLRAPVDALEARAGSVSVRGDASRSVTYAALLAGKSLKGAVDPKLPLTFGSARRTIGTPVARVDLPPKVTGTFRYVHDVRVPGMLHGRVVLPARLGARAAAVDEASLGALRGRVRIVREKNVVGVVGASEDDVVRAARSLSVQWEGGDTLPPLDTLADIVQHTEGKPRVVVSSGTPDARARMTSATYAWPFQSHGSIGPSCAVADVRKGSVTVWSATQGVYPLRGAIAELLAVAPATVKVTYLEGAGCYGHNGADDSAAFAALFSRAAGAPVRVQYSRSDESQWDPKGPAMVMKLAGAVERDKIVAWDATVFTPSHSGRPDGKATRLLPSVLDGSSFDNAAQFVGGDRNAKTNYVLPVQRVSVVDQPKALLRYSALRGLGGTANTFANESFVDELAHAAKADPLELRLAHLNDPRARAVLEALRPACRAGRGLAFVRYENTGAYVGAVADVTVDRAGGRVRANQIWIAHDCGMIVNPDGLRNQIEGNVVQALSRALFEEVRWDAGGLRSYDWRTYRIARFSDVPEVTITLIDRPSDPILGAGEASTTVVAPAIANAIFAQTGARLRTVPFTPDRVLAALGHAS